MYLNWNLESSVTPILLFARNEFFWDAETDSGPYMSKPHSEEQMIWGWHYSFVSGEKKRVASSQRVFCSFLLLICGHVQNLTLPCLFLFCFSHTAFPTRTNWQLHRPGSYTWTEVNIRCFRRGWICTHSQLVTSKLYIEPLTLHSFYHVDRENTNLSGQTRFAESLPGCIYDVIKIRIHSPCPPFPTHPFFLLNKCLENIQYLS